MAKLFALMFAALFIVGCGRPAEKPVAVKPPDRILATVNGEPIYNRDLKLALALRLKNNPNFKITPATLKEQIELIVDERLTLQHRKRSDSIIKVMDENPGIK